MRQITGKHQIKIKTVALLREQQYSHDGRFNH